MKRTTIARGLLPVSMLALAAAIGMAAGRVRATVQGSEAKLAEAAGERMTREGTQTLPTDACATTGDIAFNRRFYTLVSTMEAWSKELKGDCVVYTSQTGVSEIELLHNCTRRRGCRLLLSLRRAASRCAQDASS